MTRETWEGLFKSIIEYIREKHPAEIDEAYEFFWEEEDPGEFLGGTVLTMGFHNFEDWMVCDFKGETSGKTFIERYIEDNTPSEDENKALKIMAESFICLYEVKEKGDNTVTLTDIVREKDVKIKDERLENLTKGDIFGARIIDIGQGPMLTKAIYPFGNKYKEHVMTHLNAMYKRYAKHCEGQADMETCLRQETYTINTVWVTCLFRAK